MLLFGLVFMIHGGCLRGNDATAAPWFQRSLVGSEVGPTSSPIDGSTNDRGITTRFDRSKIAGATKDRDAEYLVSQPREGDQGCCNSTPFATRSRQSATGCKEVLSRKARPDPNGRSVRHQNLKSRSSGGIQSGLMVSSMALAVWGTRRINPRCSSRISMEFTDGGVRLKNR